MAARRGMHDGRARRLPDAAHWTIDAGHRSRRIGARGPTRECPSAGPSGAARDVIQNHVCKASIQPLCPLLQGWLRTGALVLGPTPYRRRSAPVLGLPSSRRAHSSTEPLFAKASVRRPAALRAPGQFCAIGPFGRACHSACHPGLTRPGGRSHLDADPRSQLDAE